MRLLFLTIILAVVLITKFSVSTVAVEAECDCSEVTLIPTSGKVGTQVILSISGSTSQLRNEYKILLSSTTGFDELKNIVLKKTKIPVILGFIIGGFVIFRLLILIVRASVRCHRKYY